MHLGSVWPLSPRAPQLTLKQLYFHRPQFNTSKLGRPSGGFSENSETATHCFTWLGWERWGVKSSPMVPCSALMYHLVGWARKLTFGRDHYQHQSPPHCIWGSTVGWKEKAPWVRLGWEGVSTVSPSAPGPNLCSGLLLSQMHLSNKLDVVKGPQMAGGHLQIAHPPGPRFPDLHSSTWTILLAVSLFDHN